MDDIYTYSDYRKYLLDYILDRKRSGESFTYRYFSQRAGINSSGYYPQIVQGKRDLTPATILKTCTALELGTEEAEYFEAMVHFNQAKTLNEKNRLFERIIELQNRRHQEKIPENRFEFFSKWYHCAVRELAASRDFKDDFKVLGRMLMPPITEKQARQSLELLLKLNFLKREQGRYIRTKPVLTTGDVRAHQIHNFQVKMLELAKEAFDRFGPDAMISNSSTTLGISEKTYARIRQKSRIFRNEILKLAELDENPEHVYQLNMNLFLLSNPKHDLKHKGGAE